MRTSLKNIHNCAHDAVSITMHSHQFRNKAHFSQKMKLLYEKYLSYRKYENPLVDENKLKRNIGKRVIIFINYLTCMNTSIQKKYDIN